MNRLLKSLAAIGVAGALTAGMLGEAPPAAASVDRIAAAATGETTRTPSLGAAVPDPSPTATPQPAQSPEPTPTPSVPTPTPSVPTPAPSVPTPTPTPTPTAPTPDPQDRLDAGAETAPQEIQALAAAPVPVPAISRLSVGADVYAAAVAASTALFPRGSGTVVITPVSSPGFSAAAAQLASEHGAPVLPVPATFLPASISAELGRLAPTRVIVFGGWPHLDAPVLAAIRAVMPAAEHIDGSSLPEASRQAFERSTAPSDSVYLTAVGTLEDVALGANLAAAAGRRFIVGNTAASVPDQLMIDALRAAGTRSISLIHSTASVPDTYLAALRASGFAVDFVSQRDPYTQAARLAGSVGTPPTTAVVVNPARPVDVGIATTFAAVTRQALYFARWECMPDTASAAISASGRQLLLIGTTDLLSAGAAANSPCSVERSKRIARLDSAIRSTIAGYPGTYTVTVRELGGLSEIVAVGSGTRGEPASMMKIFAAWAALKLVEQGRASLSTRLPSGLDLGTCLYVMIHVSDNYCHTDIVHWIGIPAINRMIHGAGFANTSYGNLPAGVSVLYGGNRSTANDLAWMMECLDSGTILTRKWSDHLIGLMGLQIFKSRIASGIPPGIRQASKPGALWLTSGLTQGDTAIVWGSRYKYSISIVGENGPSQAALRAVSRVVYEHFNDPFGAAATYPAQQMVTVRATALRTSPGGAMTAVVGAGVPIEVLDAQRVWYQVQYGSRTLWTHFTDLRNR